PRADLRPEAGRPLERVADPGGKGGIDLRRRGAARLRARAGPAGGALRGPYGQAFGDDLASESASAFVAGNREDRARVAFRELSAFDHAEDVLGQLEQANAVGDRGLRVADALADLAQRKPELVDQHRVRAGFLNGSQLLARNVLDEPEQERVAIVRLADQRRQRRSARGL